MPLACMSRITARVVSFALAAQADRAARAFATVCAATGLPSFVPLALAAASIDPEPTTHTHKLFNERAALCVGRIPR